MPIFAPQNGTFIMPKDIISTQEATAYLQQRGISDMAIIAEMLKGSENNRLYIALQADTYQCILRNRKPNSLDFRAEFEPLIERFVRHLEIPEKEMLRIMAKVPVWDKEMMIEVLKKFQANFSLEVFEALMGLSCFLQTDREMFFLLEEIRNFLEKDSITLAQAPFNDCLFDIYDKKISTISYQNLTHLDTQLFQYAFEFGAKSPDKKTFLLWFEHKTTFLEEAKAYKLLLQLNEKLFEILAPIKQDFLPEYHFSLYRRIHYHQTLAQRTEANKLLKSLSPTHIKEYYQLYPNETQSIETEPPIPFANSVPNFFEKKLSAGNISDQEKANLHFKTAKQCLEEEDFDKAYTHIKEAYRICRALFGDYHRDTVECLVLMADYYQRKENRQEAIKHYQRALEISLKSDRHDEETAKWLFEIADMSLKNKDYQKAIDYFKRSLREWEILNVELNEMIALAHFKMGYIYDEVKSWDSALHQYSVSLELSRYIFGDNHDKVADILHNIGTVYYSRNIMGEAIRYLERAIKARVNASNEPRRALGLSYYNLALCLLKSGRKNDAQKILERAEAVFGRIHDNDMETRCRRMLADL